MHFGCTCHKPRRTHAHACLHAHTRMCICTFYIIQHTHVLAHMRTREDDLHANMILRTCTSRKARARPHMITRKARATSRLDLIGAGRRALQRWRASRQDHAAWDLAVSVVGQPLCLQVEIRSQKQALCWDTCSGAKNLPIMFASCRYICT